MSFPLAALIYVSHLALEPGITQFILSTCLWIMFYIIRSYTVGGSNSFQVLLETIILSLPLSFRSVLNTDYGNLPISWFHLFGVFFMARILLLFVIKKLRLYIAPISIYSIMFFVSSIVVLILSPYPLNAWKQFINIAFFSLMVVVSVGLVKKYGLNFFDLNRLRKTYIFTAQCTAIGLIIQAILYTMFDIELGMIMQLGGNRLAFGLLFNDFSFISLYLSTGVAMMLSSVKKLTFTYIFGFTTLLGGILVSSGRTGAAALILATILFAFVHFLKMLIRPKKTSMNSLFKGFVLTFGVAVFMALLIYGTLLVRPMDAFSDTGRLFSYAVGIKYFLQNPLTGIGLGVQAYKEVTGVTIPHNLFIQYLAQTGVIGIIPLCVLIVSLFLTALKSPCFGYALITAIAGSMFIPDIINSRFFLIIVMLTLYDYYQTRKTFYKLYGREVL